jgi:hypothetical protein
MDYETQKIIDEIRYMMASRGWEVFSKDMADRMEALKEGAIRNISSVEDLYYAKGMYEVLYTVVNYDRVVELMEEGLNDADHF